MSTTRSKRWNGKLESLTTDFLKQVLERMQSYGDRVQFDLGGPGPMPNYQVIGSGERRMTFDGSKHLLQGKAEELAAATATAVLSLEQVKTALARGGFYPTGASAARRNTTARTSSGTRSASPRVSAASVQSALDAEKYAYFKTNRASLPETIGEHSDQISALMRGGMSAEAAFAEVIKLHF